MEEILLEQLLIVNLQKKAFSMVEVLITNERTETFSNKILKILVDKFPSLKFNFDLEDFNETYPCGHSVLRVEGNLIKINSIIKIVKSYNIECQLLEDRICS